MSLLMQALKQAEEIKGRAAALPDPARPDGFGDPTLAPMEAPPGAGPRAEEAAILEPAFPNGGRAATAIPELDALEGEWSERATALAENDGPGPHPAAPLANRGEALEPEGWSRHYPPVTPQETPAPLPHAHAPPVPPEARPEPEPDIGTEVERKLREPVRTQARPASALQHVLRNRRALLIASIGGLSMLLTGAFAYLYLQISIDEARPTPPPARVPVHAVPPPSQAAAVPDTPPGAPPVSGALGTPDAEPPVARASGADAPTPALNPASEAGPALSAPVRPARAPVAVALARAPAATPNALPRPARAPQPEPVVRPGAGTARDGIDIRASGQQGLDPSLGLAYRSYLAGDAVAATTEYRKVLLRDPNNRDALLGLAAIALAAQQGGQASSLYLQLLELDPTDPDAIGGLSSLQQADPAQHESLLKKVLARHAHSGAVLFALGNLYGQQSRWAEAQQAYFRAFENAPANADYAMNLAVSLDRLGQSRLALEYYRRALDLAGKRPGNFSAGKVEQRVRELEAAGAP